MRIRVERAIGHTTIQRDHYMLNWSPAHPLIIPKSHRPRTRRALPAKRSASPRHLPADPIPTVTPRCVEYFPSKALRTCEACSLQWLTFHGPHTTMDKTLRCKCERLRCTRRATRHTHRVCESPRQTEDDATRRDPRTARHALGEGATLNTSNETRHFAWLFNLALQSARNTSDIAHSALAAKRRAGRGCRKGMLAASRREACAAPHSTS